VVVYPAAYWRAGYREREVGSHRSAEVGACFRSQPDLAQRASSGGTALRVL